MGFVVAIDGPAGCGKGSVTKEIAKIFHLTNIDTGAMYRAVALQALREGVDSSEIEKVEKILEKIKIDLVHDQENITVLLNGENVSDCIRTKEVDNCVAKFAALKCVRDKLSNMQREMGKVGNVIMEGRDIGTTIFPDADVKIYLDATVEERAKRRYRQNLEKGIESTYEEILASIVERNRLETDREISPLVKAEDAILIDTTNLNLEESINAVKKEIEKKWKI